MKSGYFGVRKMGLRVGVDGGCAPCPHPTSAQANALIEAATSHLVLLPKYVCVACVPALER